MESGKRKKPTSNKKQACDVKMSKQDVAAYRDIANKNYQGKYSIGQGEIKDKNRAK